jgi:hypothetical protein
MTQTTINTLDRQTECATSHQTTIKDWTVMVYLAGDNNLSENMAFSLESLGRIAASLTDEERARINLLAFFDGSSLTAPPMYLDFSDVQAGQLPLRQAAPRFHRTAEQHGPADAMLDFIRWCTTDEREDGRGRGAHNYALILSGHSLGFHGSTFLRDESSGQYITLPGMRRALEQANELYLKNDSDGRISILGFDSCLMSMVEVGYEFKDVARTLIASEGSLPNSGWGYAPMLSNFVAALAKDTDENIRTRSDSTAELKAGIHAAAKSFVRSFTGFYKDVAIGGGSIDISAWDLDAVGPLTQAVNRLGERLNTLLTNPGESVFRELKKILLQSHYESQTYMSDQCIDIKDFCQRLIEECEHSGQMPERSEFDGIAGICSEVIDAVDDCVLKCGFSGDAYQFSNGISMYFPWSSVALALTDSQYRALRFTRGDESSDIRQPAGPGKHWYSFLLNYVGNVTVRKARKQTKNSGSGMRTYGSIVQIPSAGLETVPAFMEAGSPFAAAAAGHTKDAPPFARGISENNSYLLHFRRFKNFELDWEISGFADDTTE